MAKFEPMTSFSNERWSARSKLNLQKVDVHGSVFFFNFSVTDKHYFYYHITKSTRLGNTREQS